jgi:thiol-disulfide isomerase/thioredoxin
MRTLRLPVRLLSISLASAGMVLAGGCQSSLSPQIRTIAAVGDRPLPPVAGTPGETVVADHDDPVSKPSAEGRVSGRVVDAWNNPVPNARVRLATSGAAGGKVVKVTTDATGRFTLNGLRPGGSYTVIAESEDAQGLVTGRSVVKAPDGQVKIRLRELQDGPAPTKATAGAPRVNVSPASNRDTAEPDPDAAPAPPPRRRRINTEDLPPAPEAEALAPEPRDRTRSPMLRLSAPEPGSHWRRRGEESASDSELDPAEGDLQETEAASPADSATSRRFGTLRPTEDLEPDDDGPNPLPPAIEPRRTRAAKPVPEPEADPEPEPRASPARATRREPPDSAAAEPIAPRSTAPASTPVPRSSAREQSAPEPTAPALEPSAPALEPAAPPLEPLAPAVEPAPAAAEPDASGKVGVEPGPSLPAPAPDTGASAASNAQSAAQRGGPGPALSPPVLAIQGGSPFASAHDTYNPFAEAAAKPGASGVGDEAAARTTRTAAGPKRPKWGDLTAQNPGLVAAGPRVVPTRGAGNGGVAAGTDPAGDKNAGATASPGARTQGSASSDGVRVAAKTSEPGKAYCRYDARLRQLVDFRLPDLQGRSLRFQDLNSDYVLIDFWGTWCPPCVSSIKHLVELQKQFGPDRLTVVGVAYEEGPRDERAKAVTEVAQRMGINYPLVLGGLDGPCPLKSAFNVQAYPTMVLVNRYGRILWRDQGATPDTLARLDRVLDSAARGDFVRR